jgi:hypothetical protein
MMNKFASLAAKGKLAVLALSIVAVMSVAPNSFATTVVNLVGSSAAFNAFGLAARFATSGSGPGVCGGNSWSVASGTATGVDSRSSTIDAVGGSIWVVWDNSTTPTIVCTYLNIDSVVGNRLFFAVPQGTLDLPSSAIGTTGTDQVPTFTDTTLPAAVQAAVNGVAFTAAVSDIRPEDALFATTRALTALGTKTLPGYLGEGYGPGPVGVTINSEFSSKYAQVVNFAMSGTDPISGDAIPAYAVQNIGGQVLMVLVNTADTSAAGLGNSAFNNVDRFTLARVLAGLTTRTRDLIPSSGLPQVGLQVLLREPLSGTWNTMEYCIPNSREIALSQETGVNPAVDNPLDQTSADGATRRRVIGTGEMVKEVGLISDAFGYAFFSFGNVKPIVSTGKYLTVDGVDPIQASYTGGTLPTCTAPCAGAVTFPNVINGSYPIWNIMRVITPHTVPTAVTSLINAAESQVANIPDFVPIGQMLVFRSHYAQSGIAGKNGHAAREIESGGDMGGAVLTVQEDLDSLTDTKKEIGNEHQ